MANINLLPWREELRQENQRQFISVLGLVAVLGVVFMYAVYSYFDNQLDNQRERNRFLQTEIRKLDSKIKEIEALEKERQELVERMALIQDLQKSRPQIVHVFDEIVMQLPEGINLSRVTRSSNVLTFKGLAESSPRISKFMRNFNTSKWIQVKSLDDIAEDKDSGSNRQNFTLRTEIGSPNQKEGGAK